MKIFIEFWKAKDDWHQLSKEERGTYLAQINPVMQDLVAKGVTLDAWGKNEDSTLHKANYDFFAITKLPTQELLDEFQTIIEGAGWYNYFEQTNMSGEDVGVGAVIGQLIELKK